MSKKVLFSHVDRFGRRTVYEVDARDAEVQKIYLLEESFTGRIGDVFIFENNSWEKLDYFNS